MFRSELIATIVIALAIPLAGCTSMPQQAPLGRIDLITIGVSDLDAQVAELERLTGVKAAYGGEHPSRGTHNALLSLGDGAYLEVLAASPDSDTAEAADLNALTRPTPLWWGVSVQQAGPAAASLRSAGFTTAEPIPGTRRTPAGDLLQWRTLVLESPPKGAPFFIEWSRDSVHPSASSPAGCRLQSLDIATPVPAALDKLLRMIEAPVRVREAAALELTVNLDCPRGAVSFSTTS